MELVIKPQKGLRIDWKELWAYRELFYFFVWRDVKVRYKQTVIGLAWAILQPFILMVVFTLFFNKVAGISSGATPYAVFSYSGLLFWNYFSQALNRCSESMPSNRAIITKTFFPLIIAALSATIVGLVDFFSATIAFVGLMIYFKIAPGLEGVLLFLPMVVVTFLAASGLGMFFAALNVKYRDVRHALPFFVHTLLFFTPVIYPLTLVPEKFQRLLFLNPMTGVITVIRSGLLEREPIEWGLVSISLASTLTLFLAGIIYFKWREREFADIL